MSQTDHFKGVLKPINSNYSLETQSREICLEEGFISKEENCSNYLQLLLDYGYKKYILYDGKLYKVCCDFENLNEEDIFDGKLNPDGTIEFDVKYYNGGCCFDEAIECVFKKLKQKE